MIAAARRHRQRPDWLRGWLLRQHVRQIWVVKCALGCGMPLACLACGASAGELGKSVYCATTLLAAVVPLHWIVH